MGTVPQMTDDERRGWFDYYLRRAAFFGECNEAGCVGIDRETWMAPKRVTNHRTLGAVTDARAVFERELNLWKETAAVERALQAGEIPHDPRGNSVYYPEMVSWGSVDVQATKAWLEANRQNPGEIYRAMVLDHT